MKSAKYLGTVLNVGLLATALAISLRGPVAAQSGQAAANAQGSAPVTVVNTPLPVSGTIAVNNPAESPVPIQDVNAPGLQPFRTTSELTINALNSQKLVATVPAGKRLVIEYLSWYVGTANDIQIVFGALRNGQLGPLVAILEIHPPHPSASVGGRLQDGSQPTRLYFEPGEEVWVSGTKSDVSVTGENPRLTVTVSGYFISL